MDESWSTRRRTQGASPSTSSFISDGQQLLSMYPFANATPSTHVARHLSNLTITAPIPTYIQPQPTPGAFTQLQSQAMSPGPQHQYWNNHQTQAISYLSEDTQLFQSAIPNNGETIRTSLTSHWAPNFPTSPFSNTVLQSTNTQITSSSLRLTHSYPAQESKEFFNSFLTQTTREVASQRPAQEVSLESPDPLAIIATPTRKRKSGDMLSSPTIKRMQSSNSLSLSSRPNLATFNSLPSRKLEPYVDLPALPREWTTPSVVSKSMQHYVNTSSPTHDDKNGFSQYRIGSDSEETDVFVSSGGRTLPPTTSTKTGDRDDLAPVEKLISLLEDIFEAEDSLSTDSAPSDKGIADFFSPLTDDWTRPMLSPSVVRKLTKNLGQVARPTRRLRLSSRDARGIIPRHQGGLADVETQSLSRLLKLLERSVHDGEDLDPFLGPPVSQSPTKKPTEKSKKKIKKGRGNSPSGRKTRSRSRTPEHSDNEPIPMNEDTNELTDGELDKLERDLERAKESVLAADCCVALLSIDLLPKQLYSEELITSCLATIKNQLTKIIYPFVEATNDLHGHSSRLLIHVAHDVNSNVGSYRRQIGEIFQALSAVFPRINSLLNRSHLSMSDSIIIQAVYIAIGPFFVVELGVDGKASRDKAAVVLSTLGGNSAMRGLRLSALSLIRSIFANHEGQRSWIIEEILTSLIKLPDLKQKSGQFRLRDGRSIHTVSALLLQLVQTSPHNIRTEVRRLNEKREQSLAESSLTTVVDAKGPFLNEKDREEIRMYTAGLDSARQAAKTIILFLTQRSGKGKATKTSNEAEYRAILDNLISDLLTVLYWPEWPAATLLLSIICKIMVSSLDDVKSASTDNNGAKTMALDHLGTIAARLRTSSLASKFKADGRRDSPTLASMDEIVADADIGRLENLIGAHLEISLHLSKRSHEDQAYDSAKDLTAATWGVEIAHSLTQCDSVMLKMANEGSENTPEYERLLVFATKLKNTLRDLWKDASNDVFDVGSEADVSRVDHLAEEVGVSQALKNAFDPILNVILVSLDAAAVFIRTKALRALGTIVTSDPSILHTTNVKRAIEGHLLDSSPAVRDASVELVGKYIIQIPEVAGDYYYQIADRIADTGLAVRKRVIKLFKTIYYVTDDLERRVDICSKLVLRLFDEDENVKDLAIKTIEELWFTDMHDQPTKRAHLPEDQPLLNTVCVIMGVTGNFRDRQSPVEDLLHQIISEKQDRDRASILQRYCDICDALVDTLVDGQDLPNFNVVNCIKTIYMLTAAHPAIMPSNKAATLLPYLKNASSPEEQQISDYILKIFRACIPLMTKSAGKFGQDLQSSLQPMILKPSASGGLTALQETVACLCVVVDHLTHEFSRLVGLLKSCIARLQTFIDGPIQATNAQNLRALAILVYIVSLLAQHCDFERLRADHKALVHDLNAITEGPITEHVYTILLKLYEKFADPAIRNRLLQCFGFLFRAHPTLMTIESSSVMMDAIFASLEEEAKGRLLKIIQEFLFAESSKHVTQDKTSEKLRKVDEHVNMAELVGNTDGFADSGVSSAIVQRYLPQILEAALTNNIQVQASAVDIIGFTIKQGLAHPLQCLPVIIALETCPNNNMSTRASALHAILQAKYASLINGRYIECARTSFSYQKKIAKGPVQGTRAQPEVAVLHRWYSLVRDKRGSRQEFLKAVVRVFDVDLTSLLYSQDDVDFCRYMGENLATFDYKTQEEVLTVIRHLTSVLSVAGMQLVGAISPYLDSSLNLTPPKNLPNLNQPTETSIAYSQIPKLDGLDTARASVVIGVVLLLKSYLKALYGLSEDKCSKWVPGKKSAIGDKLVSKRRVPMLSWEQMPFAIKPLLSSEDAVAQTTKFLELWEADPATAEPEAEID